MLSDPVDTSFEGIHNP